MKATITRLVRAARSRLVPDQRSILRESEQRLLASLAPLIESSVRLSIASTIEERVAAPLREAKRGVARNLERIDSLCSASTRAASETDLLLDGLVREVVRLQMQVEYLQHLVAPPGSGSADDIRLIDRVPPPETIARAAPAAERVLVG
jgi:hypothetical protein